MVHSEFRLWANSTSHDTAIVAIADRRKGYVLFVRGRFGEAQQSFERALQVRFAMDDPQPAFWFFPVHHPSMSRAMLSLTMWPRGFAERAYNEAKASLDELGATAPQLSIRHAVGTRPVTGHRTGKARRDEFRRRSATASAKVSGQQAAGYPGFGRYAAIIMTSVGCRMRWKETVRLGEAGRLGVDEERQHGWRQHGKQSLHRTAAS